MIEKSHFSLLEKYLLEPESYWPSTHIRNANKINRFVAKGMRFRNESKAHYIDNIINLACLRKGFDCKHLYLVNTGSAGSHWLEAMLGLLPNFHNGGEIYLPKEIVDYLATLSPDKANVALDAIYLAHVGCIYSDSLSSSLSNSAHLANHRRISQFSVNKCALLLLRNPVDVVISRTFRKNEYKNDIARNLSDKQYLEKNCAYVEKFFNEIDVDSFDMVVKYEDFLESPRKNLSKLNDLLSLSALDDDLDNAVSMTSKEEVEKLVKKGEAAITNIYLGEKKEYHWAKDYVCDRLNDVISKYGYD